MAGSAVLWAACATGGGSGTTPGGETVVLVTRHAERASSDANANLSPEGQVRARALAQLAERFDVAAVYTTDLCRTAQTGDPAARAAGVPLRAMSSGSSAAGLDACTPPLGAPVESGGGMAAPEAAARIVERHRGSTVLVVGHSNTVPELVGALTGESPCPTTIPLDSQGRCFLPESAYGDVYVVHLPATGRPRVDVMHAGN